MGLTPQSCILVTGGAGYIGSHTCKALAEGGFTPVVYDNFTRGHAWAAQWGPVVKGDLSDDALLKQTLRQYRIQAVMHFAAHAYVGESMQKPDLYFRNNVVNSLNLFEAMREESVDTIVFSSSCATYGIADAVPIVEETVQRPINPYGDSKLFVEKMLHWLGQAYGLRWGILRYFNAAGADPDGLIGECHAPETHLIPLAIMAALDQAPPVRILGSDYPTPDGTCVRDYVHVSDLGQAHVLFLRYLQQGGRSTAINLGSGRGHSVREVISMVEKVSGCPVPIQADARRVGDPPVLLADPAKARKLLSWVPRHSSLSEIIQTAWRWHSDACHRHD